MTLTPKRSASSSLRTAPSATTWDRMRCRRSDGRTGPASSASAWSATVLPPVSRSLRSAAYGLLSPPQDTGDPITSQ